MKGIDYVFSVIHFNELYLLYNLIGSSAANTYSCRADSLYNFPSCYSFCQNIFDKRKINIAHLFINGAFRIIHHIHYAI